MKLKLRFVCAGLLVVSLATAKGHRADPLIEKMKEADQLLSLAEAESFKGKGAIPYNASTRKFQNQNLESARAKLRDLDSAIRQASDSVSGQKDKRLKVITPVAIRYLQAQTRVMMLYARAAHAEVGGRLDADLSEYSFEQLDLNLVLGKKAGLTVIAAMGDAGAPAKARHVANGVGPDGDEIEIMATEEQKQFAEFMSLARAPEDWSAQRIKSELEKGTSGGLGINSTFSFGSPEAYAKFLQFSAVRESLINRWALNRMMSQAVSASAIRSCGKQILSFRPGADGLITSSPAYRELEAADRYESFRAIAPKVVAAIASPSLGDVAGYGDIVLEIVRKIPGVAPEQLSYVRDNKATIGGIVADGEKRLWDEKAMDIVANSTLNGDDMRGAPTAARVSWQAFAYRMDAIKKVIWENLKISFPSANRAEVDRIVAARLESKKASYIAGVESRLKSVTGLLDQASTSSGARASRLSTKENQLFGAIRGTISAAAELNYLVESKPKENSKVPSWFRTAIEDPMTLRLFFEASTAAQFNSLGFTIRTQSGAKAMVDRFFTDISKDFAAGIKKAGGKAPANLLATVVSQRAKQLIAADAERKAKEAAARAAKEAEERRKNPYRYNIPVDRYVAVRDATYVAPRPKPFPDAVDEDALVGSFLKVLSASRGLVANNRAFTSTIGTHRVLVELLTTTAYNSSPALRLRTSVGAEYHAPSRPLTAADGMAMRNGYLPTDKPGQYVHETQFWPKERTLLEHAATLGYNNQNGAVNEKKVRELIRSSLKNAASSAGGVVERYCSANPMKYKEDKEFRNLFRASSALRNAVASSSGSDVKKMDEAMSKAVRSWHERVLEDYINPIMTVVGIVGLVMLAVWTGGLAAPGIAAMAAAFYATTAGIALTSLMAAATAVNLYFNINVNVLELPPQIGFQGRVANTQIGEARDMVEWDQYLSDRRRLHINQAVTAITAIPDAMFIRSAFKTGVAALSQSKFVRQGVTMFSGSRGGGASRTVSVKPINPGFVPVETVPSAQGLFTRVASSRLTELRKLMSVGGGGSIEGGIPKFLDPYLDSSIAALRKDIDLYRSTLQEEFWIKQIQNPEGASLGFLPKSARAAARSGNLQGWYTEVWPQLKPSMAKHVEDLETALKRLSGLESKTNAIFKGSFQGDRVKYWSEVLTDDELHALRGLVKREAFFEAHLPHLDAADDAARLNLLGKMDSWFSRSQSEFVSSVNPGADDVWDLYHGVSNVPEYGASEIRADVEMYERWLKVSRPSL